MKWNGQSDTLDPLLLLILSYRSSAHVGLQWLLIQHDVLQLTSSLTTVRHVNKTDVITLGTTFGVRLFVTLFNFYIVF